MPSPAATRVSHSEFLLAKRLRSRRAGKKPARQPPPNSDDDTEHDEEEREEDEEDDSRAAGAGSGAEADTHKRTDGHFPGLAADLLGERAFHEGGAGFAHFLHTNCRTAEALTSAIDELKTRRQDAGKRLDDAPEEMRIRAQAVIESVGKESRHGVYARLKNPAPAPPPQSPPRRRSTTAPRAAGNGQRPARRRKRREPTAQPGDAQILARRGDALEILDALADRRDVQKELAGENEQAEQVALILDALDVRPPTTKPTKSGADDAEWHDMAHAEKLKAYITADWLINSDEITRRQIDALPTTFNSLGADAFQTMMCATIGGMLPMFAGKEGKPIRVPKANAGGEVRTDSALDKPLDARATNLLSTDTGTGTGAFDVRHDGLRDRIYQEAAHAGCAVAKEVELGTEHGLAQALVQRMRDAANGDAGGGGAGTRARDLAKACLQMRLDLTAQFPSDDSKLACEFKSVSLCKSHVVRSGMRSGGSGDDPHTKPFMTTADAVANKARIQRGDKATEVDEALNGGAPAFHTAMAKQGVMHGIAVGGCCELSTSAHHLVAKIGEEQGYKLAESSGMDIEDAITIATRLLKGRIAKQVWRDYHKHAFARRCYADPSDMGLKALQLSDRRREQDQTEREQLQLQHTLLTRLHHGWRRGIGWIPVPRCQGEGE